ARARIESTKITRTDMRIKARMKTDGEKGRRGDGANVATSSARSFASPRHPVPWSPRLPVRHPLTAEAFDDVEEVGRFDGVGEEAVEAGGACPLAVVVHREAGDGDERDVRVPGERAQVVGEL